MALAHGARATSEWEGQFTRKSWLSRLAIAVAAALIAIVGVRLTGAAIADPSLDQMTPDAKLVLVSEQKLPNGEVKDTYSDPSTGDTIVVRAAPGRQVIVYSEDHSGGVSLSGVGAAGPSK